VKRILVLLATLLPFAAVQAGPDGSQLYARHCAACHGEQGTGGVGVPLALPAFLSAAPDRYLEQTIRHGRPGRVMPAFGQLSDAEVQAIVAHIRAWHPQSPAPLAARIPGDVAHGKTLFAQHCAACHGADGKGGHGTGVTFSRPRDLPIIAPALNNPGFLVAAPDGMIKDTLMHGREGTPMVSFLEQGLSERDIDAVVAYVRSFEAQAAAPHEAEDEAPIFMRVSPYGLQETIEGVKRAAAGFNFRLIREQYLQDGLVPEGEEDPRQVIIYSCNFKLLDDVLKIDPRVGLFLPCRVTVVEQNDEVRVMTINPRRLSYLFNNRELDEACKEMARVYEAMLEEATL
jgi:cytochrome c oxidase cbb3-type subunit 3